jgi:hypothetical protein
MNHYYYCKKDYLILQDFYIKHVWNWIGFSFVFSILAKNDFSLGYFFGMF